MADIWKRTDESDALSAREVFVTYAEFVWRAARYLGVAEADLDDVCQEVFVVVHRRIADFEARSSLRTWLYGICLRVVAGHRRKAGRRRERLAQAVERPQAAPVPSPLESAERAQARALLQSALDRLDEDKRAVFVLYEIEQLSMEEVAKAVGCPLKTAYSRLYVARREVTEALERVVSARRVS